MLSVVYMWVLMFGLCVCECEREGVCDVGQVMQEQEAPILALFGQLVEIH